MLLENISYPSDLRKYNVDDLKLIAEELRQYILESVSKTGGHLSSNLGTVELTVAIHHVFNTPFDKVIWDVGHQTYAHKILTGRKGKLNSIRKYKGISGFPKISESEYDVFGTAHSSTSISAAYGISVANRLDSKKNKSIAIIGDGAMTAGMAYEALNNAGASKDNILIILNDNDMSISENVGALNNYLARALSSNIYSSARKAGGRILKKIPVIHDLAKKTEEHVKGFVTPGTLFEELGFNYIGPIDGHDVKTLVKTLKNISSLEGPQFLHIVTKKGKGYDKAEQDPIQYHGVGTFDTGVGLTKKQSPITFTNLFSNWIVNKAETDSKLCVVTPAMREGSGLVSFSQKFPSRYFDVGIAEQHALTFAAGLAVSNFRPIVAIYSTFLQRAYDQFIHDIALQNLNVTFAVDRAGFVGADGATHHGAYDLSFIRCIPNIVLMVPSSLKESWQMLDLGYNLDNPSIVRYPRGTGEFDGYSKEKFSYPQIELGRSQVLRDIKSKITILFFGPFKSIAMKLGELYDARVVNMRFVKPIDIDEINFSCQNSKVIVTLEENAKFGGAGSCISEIITETKKPIPVLKFGIPDYFLDHGTQGELLEEAGITYDKIVSEINNFLK